MQENIIGQFHWYQQFAKIIEKWAKIELNRFIIDKNAQNGKQFDFTNDTAMLDFSKFIFELFYKGIRHIVCNWFNIS